MGWRRQEASNVGGIGDERQYALQLMRMARRLSAGRDGRDERGAGCDGRYVWGVGGGG